MMEFEGAFDAQVSLVPKSKLKYLFKLSHDNPETELFVFGTPNIHRAIQSITPQTYPHHPT